MLQKELNYDSVTCLTESRASEDAISSALGRIKRDSGPLDSLFVFFSGHGFRDRNRSYFMPWDAELKKLKFDGIRLEDVIGELEASPAQHKFLVLDCCHSGGAAGKAVPRASFSATELKQLGGKGLYILTSCTTEQESWEDDRSKQGYFTRFFLEGIQKGKADKSRWGNRDGLLSGEELYLYIFDHLPKQVRTDMRREQQPQRKPPEVGQTLIAKVGKVFGGEVVFRLKSIPGGAKVVVNDKQRGATPEDADTPLEITLELAREQRVVVSKENFNPWVRTLNPQRREPVELTAVLHEKGTATDRRYENAIKLYKRKADSGVDFLELLIEEDAPDAPKALLYLCREHHLKRNQLSSAIERANRLREKYGALDESAQADKALFQHAVSKFEKDTPFNRSIDGQQALVMSLGSFVKNQPENRYVEGARGRIEKARSTIYTHYTASATRLLKRFEGDLEDGLFTAAEARLKAYQQILDDADRAQAGLKVEQGEKVETLRGRMAKRKAYLAEMTAWRKGSAEARSADNPELATRLWATFLQSWPQGTMAARAQQALKEAKQAAEQWHKAEYEKAIGKAKTALDKGDFSAAETAVSQALRHRPDDASAKAIQNQLVPILVISSDPAGATVSITPTPPSAQTPTRLPARIKLRKNESYTIAVSKEGYRTETGSLRTTRGGEYPLVVQLEKLKLPGKKFSNTLGMDLVL
ncbi:MAG: caspase family protein, partial [Planctomycetota bacterium]|nr:caspase family protein [Planctomycetota bacterium]